MKGLWTLIQCKQPKQRKLRTLRKQHKQRKQRKQRRRWGELQERKHSLEVGGPMQECRRIRQPLQHQQRQRHKPQILLPPCRVLG